ncbi:MAG: pilus assembly protein TadG-related protein [Actinomycetota bacterium]|nr:pilus assembly protein TadG-related protein [Actinomycetota bacterium]
MTRDEGSVLLLVIGFAGILLTLVAVVADVSAVVLAKRSLASAADGAAVSAVQALDLDAVYDEGLGDQIPLSTGDARARVAAYEGQMRRQQLGLRLVVRLEGRTAVVTGSRVVRLPFRLPGTGPVRVFAVARARAPVLP